MAAPLWVLLWVALSCLLPPPCAALPLDPSCACACPDAGAAHCPKSCSRCSTLHRSCTCNTSCGFWERCDKNYEWVRTFTKECWLGSSAVECRRSCVLSTDRCVDCRKGYFGPQCEKQCPHGGKRQRMCHGHGRCDDGVRGTGRCRCDLYYAGPACEYSDFTTCHGRGAATHAGGCECFDGYCGEHCNFSDKETCSNHGRVNDRGECACRDRWGGKNCRECLGVHLLFICLSIPMTIAVGLSAVAASALVAFGWWWAFAGPARRRTPRAAAHLAPAKGIPYGTFEADGGDALPKESAEVPMEMPADFDVPPPRMNRTTADGVVTNPLVRALPILRPLAFPSSTLSVVPKQEALVPFKAPSLPAVRFAPLPGEGPGPPEGPPPPRKSPVRSTSSNSVPDRLRSPPNGYHCPSVSTFSPPRILRPEPSTSSSDTRPKAE